MAFTLIQRTDVQFADTFLGSSTVPGQAELLQQYESMQTTQKECEHEAKVVGSVNTCSIVYIQDKGKR